MDGVCGGIFDEEREQGRNAADEQGENEEIDEEEDEQTATHGER